MLSILSQLPRTIVLLLQPGDFTKFQTFRNRGFICNLILTNRFQGVNNENLSQGTFIYFIYSCDCLFDGNITQNTKKLQKLMRSYQKINDELAKYFTKGDFVVETLPALLGLPPQIRRVDLISICYEKSVKSNHYFYYLFHFFIIRRGYSVEVNRQAFTHDCLHYTGKTQGMVRLVNMEHLFDFNCVDWCQHLEQFDRNQWTKNVNLWKQLSSQVSIWKPATVDFSPIPMKSITRIDNHGDHEINSGFC